MHPLSTTSSHSRTARVIAFVCSVVLGFLGLAPHTAAAQTKPLTITGLTGTHLVFQGDEGPVIWGVDFTVKNTGTRTVWVFTVSDCGPFTEWIEDSSQYVCPWPNRWYPAYLLLDPGQTGTVTVQIAMGSQSAGTVSLTVGAAQFPGGWDLAPPFDTKQADVTVSNYTPTAVLALPPVSSFQPSVTPKGTTATIARGTASSRTFTVQNVGSLQATYSLAATCGAMTGCSANKSTTTLDPGATDNVVVSFTTQMGLAVSDAATLTATYTNANNQSISDNASVTVTTPAAQPSVAPKTGTVFGQPVLNFATFQVTNVGPGMGTFSLVATCDAWAAGCYVMDAGPTLQFPANMTSEFQVVFGAAPGGSPTTPAAHIRLIASLVTDGVLMAVDTGLITALVPYGRPVITPKTQSTTGAAHLWSNISFTVTNSGNAASSYTIGQSCSGGMTCPGGINPITLQPGASTSVSESYTPPGVGQTGTMQFIVNRIRAGGQTEEADTAYATSTGADLTPPALYVTGGPPEGSTTGAGTISVDVFACDPDGQIATPTATLNGTALSTTFTSPTSTYIQCNTSRIGTYVFTAAPGANTLVLTTNDGVHTTTVTSHFTYDAAGQARPTVTARVASELLRGGQAWADTFDVHNPGPVAFSYTLSTTCPTFTSCVASPSPITVGAGQTAKASVSYVTATAGALVYVGLKASYTSPTGSTSTSDWAYTPVWLDQIAPTAVISGLAPNSTISLFPNFAVQWCDADGSLASHTVSIEGTPLTETFVSQQQTGCTTAGASSWSNVPVTLGAHTLTATATDVVGHVTTSTLSFTFALPPVADFQPRVTPRNPSAYVIPNDQTWVYAVRNAGTRSAQYRITPVCGAIASSCQVDKPTLTLAAGATDSVRVTFTVPALPTSPAPIKVIADYTDLANRVAADTGVVTGLVPTLAMLYQPQVVSPGTVYRDPSTATNLNISPFNFSITNAGIAPVTYRTQLGSTNGWATRPWILPDSAVTVNPGQTVFYQVQLVPPNYEGAVGEATVLVSYTVPGGPTVSAEATATLVTRRTIASILVAPRGPNPRTASTADETVFDISNTGNVSFFGTATVTCTGMLTNCRFEGGPTGNHVSVSPGQRTGVTTIFEVGTGSTGTMTVAVDGTAGFSTLHVTSQLTVHRSGNFVAVAVTPHDASETVRPNRQSVVWPFVVTNVGSVSGLFNWAYTCASGTPGIPGGSVSCVSGHGQTRRLDPGKADTVRATFNTTSDAAPGLVTLTASSDSVSSISDVATLTVTLGAVADIAVDAHSLTSGSVIARDQCLTIAAGDNAAYECGDLRVVHPLPATTTMNKTRAPTLIYNSAHARGHGIIAADVTIAGGTNASQVTATLRITNAANQVKVNTSRTIPWLADLSDDRPHRIAIQFNAADATLVDPSKQAGVFNYTVEVRSVNDTSIVGSDNGTVIVVDRHSSPFGAGWWLDGYEQIISLAADNSKWLWVGGDGSARVYVKQPSGVWAVTPTVDRPDILVGVGLNYRRMLPDSAYVEFNGMGQHIRTVNKLGHTTTFVSDSVLRSIKLPVVGSATAPSYSFDYDGLAGGPRLRSVTATAGSASRVVSLHYNGATRNLTAIPGPTTDSVRFTTDASGLVSARINRLGYGAGFLYDSASLLRQVTIDNNTPIATKFCAAESTSLTQCSPVPIAPDGVRTFYDGPRPDGDVPDYTWFYLTQYGAPKRIINAVGEITEIERTNGNWPMLPTALIQPNGHRTEAAYDPTRGLVLQTADISPLGGANGVTHYTWHPKWDEVIGVTSPEHVLDTLAYDATIPRRLWQQRGSNSARRVFFNYDVNTGLVSSTTVALMNRDSIQYDAVFGNVIGTMSRAGYWTTIQRDALGRDSVSLTAVDASDLARDGVESRRVKTVTQYDLFDRVVSSRSTSFLNADPINPQTLQVVSIYDAENLLQVDRSSIPDPNNIHTSTTKYFYDPAGRKTVEEAPDHMRDSTFYDAAGNVTRHRARNGDVLTMSYDTLNRVKTRSMLAKTYAAETLGAAGWAKFPMHPIGGAAGVTIPADVATFTYDALGNIKTANNGDAQVARQYYPNGLLQSETQRIRTYQGSDFSRHVFTIGYSYDLDGRRVRTDRDLNDPVSYSYVPGTGELQSVNASRSGASFTYDYDAAGRLAASHLPGSITDTNTFDPGDRLIRRNEFGANYLRTLIQGQSNIIHGDTLEYDAREKVTRNNTIVGYATMQYTGLGAIENATRLMLSGQLVQEHFAPDAMGNVRQSDDGAAVTSYLYEQLTGRLARTTASNQADSTRYDAAGNQTHYGRIESLPGTNMSSLTRSYYGADGKLRVTDRRVTATYVNGDGTTTRGVSGAISAGASADQLEALEEYRYDALGRRVLKRSRRTTCEPFCLSAIERYVWDGDNLLREFRYPGRNSIIADSLEADFGLIFRVDTTQIHDLDPPTVDTVYSPHYGSVTYTHAGGMDRPLMLERHDYGQDSLLWGEVPIVLHYDHKGIVDEGTFVSGRATASLSLKADWPGTDIGVFGTKQNHRLARSWFGGLPDGMRDASGFQYRRNRYYDPVSGRFTQEDPIGLAGGKNLYGFASGDPVNFTDPFGLCPAGDNNCEALVAAYSAIGAAAGFWFGGGTGALEMVATGGLAAPVAVAQTAVATGLGAAVGGLVGEIVNFATSATSGDNSAAQAGRKAHAEYSNSMSGQGYTTNRASIPETRLRPDAIDVVRGIVRELKPNTASGIARGTAQLQKYIEAAAKAFGKEFQGILDFYNP